MVTEPLHPGLKRSLALPSTAAAATGKGGKGGKGKRAASQRSSADAVVVPALRVVGFDKPSEIQQVRALKQSATVPDMAYGQICMRTYPILAPLAVTHSGADDIKIEEISLASVATAPRRARR